MPKRSIPLSHVVGPRSASILVAAAVSVLGVVHTSPAIAQARPRPAEPEADEQSKKVEAEPPQPAPEPPLDTDKVEAERAIYFSGDIAFTRSDLGLLKDNTSFDRTDANGVLYGLSAGYRMKELRIGARWRVYDTTQFALWSVAASVGLSLPVRPLTPIFSAHVGYVFDQKIEGSVAKSSLPEETVLPPNINVKGLLAGVDINGSYWITKFLRLGAFVGADLMFLSREKADYPRSPLGVDPLTFNKPLYTDSGSGVGLNISVGLRGAFDIGIQ